MVDWQGLLNWSMQFQDGTHESEAKQMNEEDRKWLEEALHAHVMDEMKRVKEISQTVFFNQPKEENDDVKLDLLEEMLEILEGPFDPKNIAQLGLLRPIMDMMFMNQNPQFRVKAAQIFCTIVQNQPPLQMMARMSGAIKLVELYQIETTTKNKEQALSCLSSYLRGENIEGKIEFLQNKGFEAIKEILLSSDTTVRMKNKALSIISDLLNYEDSLKEKACFSVSQIMVQEIFPKMLEIITTIEKEYAIARDISYNCFLSLKKNKPELIHSIQDKIVSHKEKLTKLIEEDPTVKDFYEKEMEYINELI